MTTATTSLSTDELVSAKARLYPRTPEAVRELEVRWEAGLGEAWANDLYKFTQDKIFSRVMAQVRAQGLFDGVTHTDGYHEVTERYIEEAEFIREILADYQL